MTRRGDWLQTFTGKQFWPLDPRPEEVDIRDIAHALSMLCRYGGHTLHFYSVAQHSVLVTRAMREREYSLLQQRLALLHDAPEAYLVDVPKPIKPALTGYAGIERSVADTIADRFGVRRGESALVKLFDTRILHDEKRYLMRPCEAGWSIPGVALGIRVEAWTQPKAEILFLAEFERLFPEHCGAMAEREPLLPLEAAERVAA